MKKYIFPAAMLISALLLAVPAFSQSPVTYSLTRTDIVLDVTARQEVFHAGPLARYSAKYLGINAETDDFEKVEIVSVKVNMALEADPENKYEVAVSDAAASRVLSLSAQGLISTSFPSVEGEWRFPVSSDADFSGKGMPANFELGSGKVMRNIVVEKTGDKKAKETADRIFAIRENRYKILIGDTDATYSGEAMKAAIDELNRMEKDLLTLFFGYSEYKNLKASYEVIPDANAKRQMYVAFRVSDTEGLVGTDNISGRPFFLELTPESEVVPLDPDTVKNRKHCIFYRCPVICKAVLSDGGAPVLQTRIPVNQLGQLEYYYVKK